MKTRGQEENRGSVPSWWTSASFTLSAVNNKQSHLIEVGRRHTLLRALANHLSVLRLEILATRHCLVLCSYQECGGLYEVESPRIGKQAKDVFLQDDKNGK
ncbi:hypothetical protein ILYODFUR_016097 [Ilyodon furcidens]|uniref:Uncharacterized protein n=1 Tax=Ilyodon furcidens TaxID=33524 RepID=A0ABV0TC97_9TELE